jgi:hypothetical protein
VLLETHVAAGLGEIIHNITRRDNVRASNRTGDEVKMKKQEQVAGSSKTLF